MAGAVAFIQTLPLLVGARSTDPHGRTRRTSTGPVRTAPASRTRASSQAVMSSGASTTAHPDR